MIKNKTEKGEVEKRKMEPRVLITIMVITNDNLIICLIHTYNSKNAKMIFELLDEN